MAAAASAAGPDGMVSVRAFRQHYRNARERMVRQQEGGSSSRAAPAGGGLELAVAAPVPAAAAAARLAISDLRSLSDHDEVDRRIEERIARLASQASEAAAAAEAAKAEVAAQQAAAGSSSPQSQRFEKLKKHILGMSHVQVDALDAPNRARYDSILRKIRVKEEGDRRLMAEQRSKFLLAARLQKQAAAAAASVEAGQTAAVATAARQDNLLQNGASASSADTFGASAGASASGASASGSLSSSGLGSVGANLSSGPSAASSRSPAGSTEGSQQRLLREDEVILTVRVFFHGRGATCPAQELEVIGSQPLSALVDQISCLYDRPEVYSRHSW
jgi:hypothetical protein|eukprot:COSAG06_NODE_87_length_24962_cov_107.553795_3_plen_333_part_00